MNRAVRAALVLLVVAAGWIAFRQLGDIARFPWSDDWTEALLKVTLWVAPCAVAIRLFGAGSYREVAAELGLNGPAFRGYAFGLVASVPMLLLLPIVGTAQSVPVSVLVGSVVVGPFAEEVLFRGWLFRQLWLRAGWPPIAAAMLSAVAFGLAHVPKITYLLGSTPLAAATSAAAAGVLFAWLVWRWGSLWPAIGLHACMNLSWQLFGGTGLAASHPSTGLSLTNAARVATIVMAILLTSVRKNVRSTKSTKSTKSAGSPDSPNS